MDQGREPLNPQSSSTHLVAAPRKRLLKLSTVVLGVAMAVCVGFGIVGIVALATKTDNNNNQEPAVVEMEEDDVTLSPLLPVMNSVNNSDGDVELIRTSSCLCTRVFLQAHEQVPLAQTGAGCIGGCGGSEFVVHQHGQIVRRISVHWRGRNLQGIQVELTDGTRRTHGRVGDRNFASRDFTFNSGEHLVGDLILTGNGVGTRTGFIQFSTSHGRTFTAGEGGNNRFIFPADRRFLTGVHGRAGVEIDLLGVVLTRPIASARLINIQYPTLSLLTHGLNPSRLEQSTFRNDASSPSTQEIQFRRSTGTRSCFTSEASTTFGMEVSVEGGVPGIVTVSATTRWEMSSMQRRERCVDTLNEETRTLTTTIPPRETCTITITQHRATLNDIPFTADFEMSFVGGGRSAMRTSGSYSGVFVSNEMVDRVCRAL